MASKNSQRFLFLEFLDPEINDLLFQLRNQFTGGNLSSRIHVTVRGPYKSSIKVSVVRRFQSVLEGEPILIQGVGMFSNPNEFIVYIKVYSEGLRKIWWKPDYPKNKYGFNPHISLYKGRDKALAEKIIKFLNGEGIRFVCSEFRLAPYTSKQTELFSFDPFSVEHHFRRSSSTHLGREEIVQRATELVRSHQQMLGGAAKRLQ